MSERDSFSALGLVVRLLWGGLVLGLRGTGLVLRGTGMALHGTGAAARTTATHTPAPGHRGVPRAAARPSTSSGVLVVMALLFMFSPVTFAVWLVALWPVVRQPWWHWQRIFLAAVGVLAVMVLVLGGPQAALRVHFVVPAHLGGYVGLLAHHAPLGQVARQLAGGLLATQAPLGVPVGVAAGALSLWRFEHAAHGAEWHPLVQRRARVDQRRQRLRTTRRLARPEPVRRTDAPSLGVALDGDLSAWVQGREVVVPRGSRGKAIAVVGKPGSGKTITLQRLTYVAAQMGRKVCFADCKGTDPDLAAALIGAYRLANPDARIGIWPAQPLDMWRGSPDQLVSRLLAVQEWTEPWYHELAALGLRLALTAPDLPPVRSSEQLLARLGADELRELWAGRPQQERDVAAVAQHVDGIRVRYTNFFQSLQGAFDGGWWSFEDVDLTILTVPTLLSKTYADAAMRVVLEDWGHYAVGRKPRLGEDALLVVDEFSALTGGQDAAINLAERIRDVGAQVVVAAQSVEGLGDPRQAPRLLASCAGGVVLHACLDPDQLVRLAGTIRLPEQSWTLDQWGPDGHGKVRMNQRLRIDPDQVRAAQPGEAETKLGSQLWCAVASRRSRELVCGRGGVACRRGVAAAGWCWREERSRCRPFGA